MAKENKTKELVRSVKEHAGSAAKDKITEVGIRTKDKIQDKVQEQFTPQNRRQNTQSPENYAVDEVTEKAKTATEVTGEKAERVVNKSVKKIREKRAEKKALAETEIEEPLQNPQPENPENNGTTPETNNNQSAPQEKRTQDAKKQAQKKAEQNKAEHNKTVSDKPANDKAPAEKRDIKEKESRTVKGRDSGSAPDKRKPVNPKGGKNSAAETVVTEQTAEEKQKPKPKQRQKSEIKTRQRQDIKNKNAEKKAPKKLNSDAHKIKETKRSADGTKKTIKTAGKSGENIGKGVKTAKQTAEKTAKTVKKAEKTAKRTEQAAKKTAKATAKAVKATAKAIAEGAKAAVAAGKEVVAAVIAGGPVVIVIVVICLIAAIGGTCFGIFLANDETTGTQTKMSNAVSTLTTEYYNSLTAMKLQFVYDTIEIQGNTTINWRDVLAIYAVKYTNGSDGFDVATLNDIKIEKIREIMKAMNPCTGVVVPKIKPVTVVTTDANGNKVEQKVNKTQKVLVISAVHISASTQAQVYNFTDEQKKQLNELLSADYEPLWNELIGSGGNGGEIINTGSSHTPKSIFSWPLEQNNTISSSFGTRTDPITGVTKLHGGTDIAAAQGTPILAAADGTVVIASYDADGYGFYVKIKHNATYYTLYGHCSVLHVSAGQTVKKGQVIAEVGSTGHSTGPHVHFEVIQNGTRVNAMNFFK